MANPQGQDPEKLQNSDRYRGGQPADAGRADTDATPDDTYEPDTVSVNRGREQGLGVGQKDIDYQKDPQGTVEAERYVNVDPGPRVRPPDPLPPELDPQPGD
jgi:hypothetical protein